MFDHADYIAVIKSCFPTESVVRITGDEPTSRFLNFQFMDNGEYVGSLSSSQSETVLTITTLRLADDYQDTGIFTALCAAIPEYCRSNNLEQIRVPGTTGAVMPGLLVDAGFTPEELGGWIASDVSEGGAVEQYGLS